MRFILFIARRYFMSRHNTSAINVISFVSMVAVSVVTLAMLIIFSSLNGFETLVKELYGSFYPDIVISIKEGKTFESDSLRLNKVQQIEGVRSMSLVIEEKALVSCGDKQAIAMIKGVDGNYDKVNGLDSCIIRGKYLIEDKNGRPRAIIGAGLESRLDVNVSDPLISLKVHMPKRGKKKVMMANKAFKLGRLYPSGTFSIQQEFDAKYLITALPFVRTMLGYKANIISALELKIDPNESLEEIQNQLKELYGPEFNVRNREQVNQALYQVMNMESWAVYCLLTLILVIAGFNILGSLIMLVLDKRKDIFIIRSMGGSRLSIRLIFLLEGVLFSGIGATIGMGLAFILIFAQQVFGIVEIPGGTFVVSAYPMDMELSNFILVFVTVLIISLLSSWFPSSIAAKQAMELKGQY